jgi:hypothetical protein
MFRAEQEEVARALGSFEPANNRAVVVGGTLIELRPVEAEAIGAREGQ